MNILQQHANGARLFVVLLVSTGLLSVALAQEPNRQLVQNGSQSAATNSKRVALVIGNGAYTSAPVLKNPPNDARDMAATLKNLGFEVTSGINVNQKDMKRLVREFGQKLKSGGSGLFYYAGHGVQSKGKNFLIPIDADIQSEAEVEDSSVDVNLVLGYMDEAQNGLNIVILDACRNNPFARSFRSASSGLAQVDAPTGTLIAYATAPGHVASDGTGQNGLYTSELLKQMRVPGLSVTDMFMRVRAEIMKQTGSKQVPWEASSLVGSFYFGGSAPASGTVNNASGNSASNEPAAYELSYWDSIKNSRDAADFRSYLEQYPTGKFVALAKNRLKSLEGTNNSDTQVSTSTNLDLPLADCFRSDLGIASITWADHFKWAQGRDVDKLKTALAQKVATLFQCSLRTDEQLFDTYADISLVVARYVPDAKCFDGDGGVVGAERVGHRHWAQARGRNGAFQPLQWKVSTALNCMNESQRLSYYADVSVLVAGGRLQNEGSTSSGFESESSRSQVFSGGVLNGKAILLVQPAYPPIAKAAHASGQVQVQVLIDETGNVVSAHAVSGHPLLQAAAANAALASKFTPTKLSGQAVKVSGIIIYNFSEDTKAK